jgi:hypothetical protein
MFEFGIDFGVNSHCLNAKLLTGAKYSQGNFAAVGDKHFIQHIAVPRSD